MDDRQYAPIEINGLFTILEDAEGSPMPEGLFNAGEEREAFVGISIV
jgi:hypothetical protein